MKNIGPILITLLSLSHSFVRLNAERSLKYERRIRNGEVINADNMATYPFAVYLRTYSGSSASDSCSGALITRQKVLTAGHCITKYYRFKRKRNEYLGLAVLGTWNVKNGGLTLSVTTWSVHADYYTDLKVEPADNDMAIATLNQTIVFNLTENPLIAKITIDFSRVELGETLTAFGFGLDRARFYYEVRERMSLRKHYEKGLLKMFDFQADCCYFFIHPFMNIENWPICQSVNATIKKDPNENKIEQMHTEQHAALGDNGGPVIRKANGRLVGIFSGVRILEKGNFIQAQAIYPAVYAKTNRAFIEKYLD